ncbi:T9SS type A sorting domain-containing protein [bacterium]|nr:T9SS type A sorting domain-containing protein [bacterium]
MEISDAADIDVVWSEEVGYPDVINWNNAFDDIFLDEQYGYVVNICNIGTVDLEIESISSETEEFWAVPAENITVGPDEETEVTFNFSSPDADRYEGTMVITSNDPRNEGVFEIALLAQPNAPPVAVFEPDEINENHNTGDIENYPITIGNDGDAVLTWSLEVAITSEPGDEEERDNNIRSLRSASANTPNRDERSEPDDMDYEWRDNEEEDGPEYEWIDITEWDETQTFNLGDDDNTGAIDLGFTFPFWDLEYDQVNVNCDTWASFTFSGRRPWLPVEQYPMNSNEGQENDKTICLRQVDYWQGTVWFWTNESDMAIITWCGQEEQQEFSQLILYDNGLGVMQWGQGCNWDRGAGINYGDGDHGWYLGGRQNGAAIGFGSNHSWSTWIAAEPTEGQVEPDDQGETVVTINCEGLFGGTYEANITFTTNDPESETVVIPVTINVTGAPDIFIEWEEAYGYNEDNPDESVVDWNRRYEDLFSGGPYTMVIEVCNVGTEPLEIEDIYMDGDDQSYFSVEVEDMGVAVDEVVELPITFDADAEDPGEYTATLVFVSDDPDEDVYNVYLHAEAELPPVFRYTINNEETDVINSDLVTGETDDQTIEVYNDGDALLRWWLEHEITHEPGDDERDANIRSLRGANGAGAPRRDPGEPGDRLGSFNGINQQWTYCAASGWDTDNEVMWVTNSNNEVVAYSFDDNYENFEEVFSFRTNQWTIFNTWAQGVLYTTADWSQVIYRWDQEGNQLDQYRINFSNCDISADSENDWFFIMNPENFSIHVFELDGEGGIGDEIGSIANVPQLHNNNTSGGFMWVPGHIGNGGPLWYNVAGNGLYQVDVDTDEWECIENEDAVHFNPGLTDYYDSPGHDDYNIWAAGNESSDIRIFDDGIAELRWLNYGWGEEMAKEGTVEADDQIDINVHLNAAALLGGEYVAELLFTTNDPATPNETITITMNVTGVPDIDLEWDEENGFVADDADNVNVDEAVLDFNAMFDPDLYNGGPYSFPVSVMNEGTDQLVIDEITFDGDAVWTVDPEALEIDPFSDDMITLIFQAEDEGEYSGTFTLSSNDPNEETVTIAMTANCSNPPIIVIEPPDENGIERDLNTGDVSVYGINVSNAGSADLNFTIGHEIFQEGPEERDASAVQRTLRGVKGTGAPRRDPGEPGDLLGSFNGINQGRTYCCAGGWDTNNEVMWVTNSNNQVAAYSFDDDYENFEEVFSFNTQDWTIFNTWAQGVIYTTADYQQGIYRWDQEGNLLDRFGINFPNFAISSDSENNWFFIMQTDNFTIHVFELDGEGGIGEEIGSIANVPELHNNNTTAGFVWVPEHVGNGGPLWYNVANDGVYQVDVDTDEWTCVENDDAVHFSVGQSNYYDGIGHDAHNIWAAGNEQADIRIYEDGVAETRWLSYEPKEGSLASEADMDIDVTINCAGLYQGDYIADLIFMNNDPANPTARVRVLIHVTGVPFINPVWDDDAGYVEGANPGEIGEDAVIDWNQKYTGAFGVFAGAGFDLVLTIENIGTTALEVSDIVFDGSIADVLSADETEFVVDPEEEQEVVLTLFSEDVDEYDGTLTIISNAENDEEYAIPAHAETFDPPVIVIEQGEIEANLNTGETEVDYINVTNEGGYSLIFETEIDIISEPDRDENARKLRSTNGVASPRRDPGDPGDLLGSFNGINGEWTYCSAGGWDTDNEVMWVANSNNQVVAYSFDDDYENFEEVFSFNTQEWTIYNAWAQGVIYTTADWQQTIYRWDQEGNQLDQYRVNFPNYDISGDSENGWFFIMNAEDQSIHVFELDDEGGIGEEIGQINNHSQYHNNNNNGNNFMWVPEHIGSGGPLWYNLPGDGIYQIDVDVDEWTCVDNDDAMHFDIGLNNQFDSPGHDANNIWAAGNEQVTIRIYEDGVAELRWLFLEPAEGELEPNADMDLDATFNAEGLITGEYIAEVIFNSNDPINQRVIVNATLNVQGVPLFDDEKDPILNPFEGAEDIIFPDTYVEGSTEMYLSIKNGGTEALEIEGVEFDGDNANVFSVDEEEFVLDPGEDHDFIVTFSPENLREDGEMHECIMYIYSNAMNEELEDGPAWWNLFGQALTPPSVYITSDDIIETDEDQLFLSVDMLLGDDPLSVPFIIGNEEGEGRDDLNWSVDIEEIEEEERDASAVQRSLRGINGAVAPRRDPGEPGDQLGSFNGINQQWVYCCAGGWDSDNEVVWVTNSNNQVAAYSFDDEYEDFEEVFSFRTQNWTIYNTWAQGVIYTACDWDQVIYLWDQDGNLLGSYNNFHSTYGLSADSDNGWLFVGQSDGNHSIDVFELDGEGGIVEQIATIDDHAQYHGNDGGMNLLWVPEHVNTGAPLWVNVPGNGIYQVGVNVDDWTCFEYEDAVHFDIGLNDWYDSPGHDGHNIWAAGNERSDIRIFDDGITELQWITFEPDEGSVANGEEQEVNIIFSVEGMEDNFVTYEADAFITTNDPHHEVITIRCELSIGTRLQQYSDFVETNRVHNILIENILFLGETVQTGWEIGIFTEDDELAGGVVWQDDAETVVHAYGASGELDGFTNGESYCFKVYDPAVEEEYDWIRMEITDGPAVWVNNGSSTVSITALPIVEQTVHFDEGWNLISLNIIPIDEFWINEFGPDPFRMCEPTFYNSEEETWSMIQMKDENGDFCATEWDFWDIEYWNLNQGYQFNITEDMDVTWTGAPIDAQADLIDLGNGWNIMAYYPDYSLPCEFIDENNENNFYVLHEIIDRVILAKDVYGDFCSPQYGFSSMSDWEAGQGYQINLSEDIEVFNYPVEIENRAAMPVRKGKATGESHWTRPVSTGENMSVLVNSIKGLSIDEGDQIAAFDADGKLVGAGTFVNGRCGIPVWGDNSSTETVEGLLEDETFELKLWDADRELILNLSAGTIKVGAGLEYKNNGFVVLDVKVEEALPTEFSLAQNYPNPFNSVTRMAYEVPELSNVSIQVFDIAGRHVTTLVNAERQAGRYTAVWEAHDVSSGIYVVQMKAANFNSVRKVMLVK